MTPLLRFALGVAAGVLVGLLAGPSVGGALTAVLSAVGGFALWLVRAWPRTPARGRVGGVAAAVLLGIAVGIAGALRAAGDCRARIADGVTVAFGGRIASLPWPDATVELEADSLAVANGGWRACEGTVRLRPPRGVAPEPGRPVVVRGRWFTFPPESRWPAEPERSGFLVVNAIRPTSGRDHPLLVLRARAQARIRALFRERAAVAEALLLARREGLDPELKQNFTASGLTHLLAISGTHVGLVAGVIALLAGVARLPAATGSIIAAAGAVFYVIFLGAPHAATRAALQLLALLASRSFQRPAEPYTLLAACGLAIALMDPLAPLDAGFQLSFAGIFGLLAWRRPLAERLPNRIPRPLRDGLATGTAATLATTPIAALHFGTVAPIAILANLVAIPLVGAAVPAIALVLALEPLSAHVARFFATGTELLLGMLDATAAAAAAVPGGHALVPAPAVIAGLVGVAIAILLRKRFEARHRAERPPQQPMRRTVAVATVIAAVSTWPLAVRLAGDGAIRLYAIDVGQGDAFAVETPAGRWILIDAGPRTDRFDAGRARVVPFLLEHGVRHIDLLVLTHPDADHIGGAQALFDAFDVRAVVDPGIPAPKDLYLATLHAGREEGSRWLAARAGRVLRLDGVTLEFLAPLEDRVATPAESNDFSVVFRLGFGRFRALFLGDAPEAVEAAIVASNPGAVVSHVLKVGHHGSRTSTGETLLDAARPSIALLSVGRRNRYGHPDPVVLRRLVRRSVRILRTDLHGTVTLRATAGADIELLTSR